MTNAVDGLQVLPTQHSVQDLLSRMQSLARTRGMTIFSQIDFSGDAERSQLSLRPTGLLILGNPKGGTPLMLAAPTTAIDLPLKVLAWQDADGRNWLAYNDAQYLQKRHGFAPELMKNIAGLAALAAVAAAPGPLPTA